MIEDKTLWTLCLGIIIIATLIFTANAECEAKMGMSCGYDMQKIVVAKATIMSENNNNTWNTIEATEDKDCGECTV